jgi:hypothetical protein
MNQYLNIKLFIFQQKEENETTANSQLRYTANGPTTALLKVIHSTWSQNIPCLADLYFVVKYLSDGSKFKKK